MEQQEEESQFITNNNQLQQYEKAGVVEQILDSQTIINSIFNFLMGYYKDGNEWKQNKDAQLVSENGCRAIIFEVQSRISTPTILGTITEQEAKKRAELFEKSMALKLVNNYDDWKLPNTTAMDIVVDALGDLIFIALTRPIGGSHFSGLVDMSQIRQQTLQRDYVPVQEEKQGFFNKFFRKGG